MLLVTAGLLENSVCCVFFSLSFVARKSDASVHI